MEARAEVITARDLYEAVQLAFSREMSWHHAHYLAGEPADFDAGFAQGLHRARQILHDLALHLLPEHR